MAVTNYYTVNGEIVGRKHGRGAHATTWSTRSAASRAR